MTFKGDLQKFAEKSAENFSMVTRKILIDVGARIIERTPVGDPDLWQGPAPPGYAGGRARGSWQYGLNVPTSGDPGVIDPTGMETSAKIGANIKPLPAIHYITSNLVYMPRLENGWSSQAPRGMVGLVAVEFSNIVDLAAREIKR